MNLYNAWCLAVLLTLTTEAAGYPSYETHTFRSLDQPISSSVSFEYPSVEARLPVVNISCPCYAEVLQYICPASEIVQREEEMCGHGSSLGYCCCNCRFEDLKVHCLHRLEKTFDPMMTGQQQKTHEFSRSSDTVCGDRIKSHDIKIFREFLIREGKGVECSNMLMALCPLRHPIEYPVLTNREFIEMVEHRFLSSHLKRLEEMKDRKSTETSPFKATPAFTSPPQAPVVLEDKHGVDRWHHLRRQLLLR